MNLLFVFALHREVMEQTKKCVFHTFSTILAFLSGHAFR